MNHSTHPLARDPGAVTAAGAQSAGDRGVARRRLVHPGRGRGDLPPSGPRHPPRRHLARTDRRLARPGRGRALADRQRPAHHPGSAGPRTNLSRHAPRRVRFLALRDRLARLVMMDDVGGRDRRRLTRRLDSGHHRGGDHRRVDRGAAVLPRLRDDAVDHQPVRGVRRVPARRRTGRRGDGQQLRPAGPELAGRHHRRGALRRAGVLLLPGRGGDRHGRDRLHHRDQRDGRGRCRFPGGHASPSAWWPVPCWP